MVEINKVLTVKHERIITDDYQRRFKEADKCWICEDKFSIDIDMINRLERKIANLTDKLTEIVQDPKSHNKIASSRDISRRIWEMEKSTKSEKDLKNLYTELLKAVKNPEDYKSLKLAISKVQAELAREEANKKVWDHYHITGTVASKRNTTRVACL